MHARRFLFPLAGLCVGFVLACADDGPDCDSATEMEVTFHSDIAGEGPDVWCEALPASCDDEPSCDCLEGQSVDAFNLEFCLEEGGCTDDDGLLRVSCPGG